MGYDGRREIATEVLRTLVYWYRLYRDLDCLFVDSQVQCIMFALSLWSYVTPVMLEVGKLRGHARD